MILLRFPIQPDVSGLHTYHTLVEANFTYLTKTYHPQCTDLRHHHTTDVVPADGGLPVYLPLTNYLDRRGY